MKENIVFEWDEEKRNSNIVEHGIDFIEAVAVFDDPKVSIIPDLRKDYGEKRYNAYGLSNGRRMRVCFTIRGVNIIRIISMFKVHPKEWSRHYDDSTL
jgi:uncharacterized DUF497 family protein